jgi:hypothetical protein
MKINQIISETTTAGSVASVSMPFKSTQRRTSETTEVNGLKPVSKVSKAKKKGPYQNSLVEGHKKRKVFTEGQLKKYLHSQAEILDLDEFVKKFSHDPDEKQEMTIFWKNVNDERDDEEKDLKEARIDEDDLIIVPGQGIRRKTGFVPRGESRIDHEVEMALSDLYQAAKNAQKTYMMLKDRTEDEGIEGWVQEKIIKANDYLNTIREYYEHKQLSMQNDDIGEMTGGVIAAGGVGESVEDLNELFYFDVKNQKSRKPRDYGQDELERRSRLPQHALAGHIGQEYKQKDQYGDMYKIAGPKGPLPEGTEDDMDLDGDPFEMGYRAATLHHRPKSSNPFEDIDIVKAIEWEAGWKMGAEEEGLEESVLHEKAKSKSQQKFMGMVHAVQKGTMKAPSAEIKKAAQGMTKKAATDYAKTKHKGIPEKVKKDN